MFDLMNKLVEATATDVQEGVASARKRYLETGVLSKRHFGEMLSGDPTENKKYLEWMCKRASEETKTNEYIIELIKKFDQLVSRGAVPEKDIYAYKAIEDLEKALEVPSAREALRAIKREKEKDIQKVFESDKVLVISPRTLEAMQKYGRGTRWCITGKDDWENSILEDETKIYILIDKTKNKKYAIIVQEDSEYTIWDEKDKWLKDEDGAHLLNSLGVPLDVLKPFTSAELGDVKDKFCYVS
jgi:hypothetical protein